MVIPKTIHLELNAGTCYEQYQVHQGEIDSRYFKAVVLLDGKPFIIPETYVAKLSVTMDGELIVKDLECDINPNGNEKSVVYIPVNKYMSERTGILKLEPYFEKDGKKVIIQTLFVEVLRSNEGATETIYTDMELVNETLSAVVDSPSENISLDKERLSQLDVALSESVSALNNAGVDVDENAKLNDLPEYIRILAEGSGVTIDFINIGVFNLLSEMQAYDFEIDKLYHFTSSSQMATLIDAGYCYGRYFTVNDAVTNEVTAEMLQVFNSTTLTIWEINLTEGTVEPVTNIDARSTVATTLSICSGKEYRFTCEGLQALVLNLPVSVAENFECTIVFKSGETATALTCPSAVKWSGDDVASVTSTENDVSVTYNCLVPQVNKTYNIIVWYDGFNVNAAVRGVAND